MGPGTPTITAPRRDSRVRAISPTSSRGSASTAPSNAASSARSRSVWRIGTGFVSAAHRSPTGRDTPSTGHQALCPMNMLVAIAVGGAIGALGRHYVNVAMAGWLGHGFPWGTVTVNILGSFVMGVLVEAMALAWSVSPELRAVLTVGFLGAFTTFSTFSLDVATLYGRGHLGLAAFYVLISVTAAIAALFLGLKLARLVLA